MAIAHEGRLINDAIGIVHDMPTTVTMRNDQDEEYLQKINTDETNTVGKGNFNVTVSVGPSFNTQREEQAAGMMEMFTSVPLVQNVAADLVVRSQDWIGKDALADRLEYATEKQFPGITTQSKSEDEDDEVNFLKQQLQAAQQQIQEIGQQAQQMQEALQKADADGKAEKVGKVQIEMQKLEIEKQRVLLEKMKIQGELQLRKEEIEIDAMKADLDSETKRSINRDSIEADLIKNQVETNKELRRLRIEAREDDVTELEKPIINVNVENILPEKGSVRIEKVKGGYSVDDDSDGPDEMETDVKIDKVEEPGMKPIINVNIENKMPKKSAKLITKNKNGWVVSEKAS